MKDLYEPFYSSSITPKNKKYSVYVLSSKGNRKVIHFGDVRYQQYKDQVSSKYSNLDHLDKKRRSAYRRRHIKDKITNPNYPGYWSYHYLW